MHVYSLTYSLKFTLLHPNLLLIVELKSLKHRKCFQMRTDLDPFVAAEKYKIFFQIQNDNKLDAFLSTRKDLLEFWIYNPVSTKNV